MYSNNLHISITCRMVTRTWLWLQLELGPPSDIQYFLNVKNVKLPDDSQVTNSNYTTQGRQLLTAVCYLLSIYVCVITKRQYTQQKLVIFKSINATKCHRLLFSACDLQFIAGTSKNIINRTHQLFCVFVSAVESKCPSV